MWMSLLLAQAPPTSLHPLHPLLVVSHCCLISSSAAPGRYQRSACRYCCYYCCCCGASARGTSQDSQSEQSLLRLHAVWTPQRAQWILRRSRRSCGECTHAGGHRADRTATTANEMMSDKPFQPPCDEASDQHATAQARDGCSRQKIAPDNRMR